MVRQRLVLVMALLLGCGIVSIDCSADRLILGQNRKWIDPGSARREMMEVHGRSVECWVARSPGAERREPQAFVLLFIGKGSRVDGWIARVADSWGDKPVEMWGMNYPGSGGSDGPVSVAQVGPDELALYDMVKAKAGSRPIFLQGSSFGTAAALCVAARRPVDGVILQNPPPLRQLILGHYGWWNLWLMAGPVASRVPTDLDSIVNASHCTAPAIFILAGGDGVIPPSYHQRVVHAYAGPKRIIVMPGAAHDAPLTREAADELSDGKQWMWDAAIPRSVHTLTAWLQERQLWGQW